MTFLYNCRHAGDQYRISKFDDAMNVESSYLTDGHECDCPAGVRPRCRHREMLPKFIERKHIGDEWFLDFDRGGWVQMGTEWNTGEALQKPEPVAEPELVEPAMAERPKGVYIRRRI